MAITLKQNKKNFYTALQLPSNIELLRKYNKKLMIAFKLGQDQESKEQALFLPSLVPMVMKQAIYKKVTHVISPAEPAQGKRPATIDIITKDGQFDSFSWHPSSPQKITAAVRWGIYKPHTVTGRVIAALGEYRVIQAERIAAGFISNRYVEKNILLDLYQDRCAALQKLESLVNQNLTKAEFFAVMKEYEQQLEKFKSELIIRFQHSHFAALDPDAMEMLMTSLDQDLQRTRLLYHANKHSLNSAATGMNSLLTFVKTQMIYHLREMQNLNQNISYSWEENFAATRGDLNSCIEDAALVIENYTADPHHNLAAEHHGIFEKEVVYDSSQQGLSPEEEQRALLAISFIEGVNTLDLTDPQRPTLKAAISKNGLMWEAKSLLKIKSMTKWGAAGSPLTVLKKMGIWGVNVVIRLAVGALDIVTLGLFKSISKLATTEFHVGNPDAPKLNAIEKIRAAAYRPLVSLGMRLRHFLYNLFQNIVMDPLKGLRDIKHEMTVDLASKIIDDLQEGQEKNIPDPLAVVAAEIMEIAQLKKTQTAQLVDEYNKILKAGKNPALNLPSPDELNAKLHALTEKFAMPDYIPTAGDWNDILNAAVHGGDKFLELFMHHIYAKHPFGGLLFSLFFAAGGFAVLTPQLVAFLGSTHIAILQKIAAGMAEGKLGGAIAVGSTYAEIAAPIWELLLHGPKSWVAQGLSRFEQDPAKGSVFIAAAIGFGGLMAYGIYIPGITHALQNDMGTFPPAALFFAGAKLGLLLVEMLHEPENAELLHSARAYKLKEFLTEHYRKVYPQKADVSEDVTNMMAQLLNANTLKELKQVCAKHPGLKVLSTMQEHEYAAEFEKLKLTAFLQEHREHLAHLSSEKKRLLTKQIEKHFNRHETAALTKDIYLEKKRSILRTTLNILVSYPIGIIRILAAALSLFLLNPYPLKRAILAFGEQMAKDLTRVMVAASKIIKIVVSYVRRFIFKTLLDVIMNSILARWTPSHAIANVNYAVSAKTDVAYENLRQLASTPVDAAVKTVVHPHPLHTQNRAASTYLKIFSVIKAPATPVVSEEKAELNPIPLAPTLSPILPTPIPQAYRPR